LLTNETYGAMQLVGPKTSFWSGREGVLHYTEQLRPGDVLIVSSYELGSLGAYKQVLREMEASGKLQLVRRFTRSALPLDTDVMQESMTHQNPLAWQLRYNRQYFETAVLRVPGDPPVLTPEQEAELNSPLPAPKAAPSAREKQLLEELRTMQSAVEQQRSQTAPPTATPPPTASTPTTAPPAMPTPTPQEPAPDAP
jgi:hypothetical protein